MIKVMKNPCNECLFTDHKVVSDSAREEILRKVSKNQSHFVCHKATIAGTEHCCKNFYEKFGNTSQIIRIAKRLNMVEFSLPPQLDKE